MRCLLLAVMSMTSLVPALSSSNLKLLSRSTRHVSYFSRLLSPWALDTRGHDIISSEELPPADYYDDLDAPDEPINTGVDQYMNVYPDFDAPDQKRNQEVDRYINFYPDFDAPRNTGFDHYMDLTHDNQFRDVPVAAVKRSYHHSVPMCREVCDFCRSSSHKRHGALCRTHCLTQEWAFHYCMAIYTNFRN